MIQCKKHRRKMRYSEFEGIGYRLMCDECTLEENWIRVRNGEI